MSKSDPTKDPELKQTAALMSALVHMKPKPHEEMKIGKKAKAKATKKKAQPKIG